MKDAQRCRSPAGRPDGAAPCSACLHRLRSDFYRRVEVDLTLRATRCDRALARLRDRESVCPQSLKMQLDGSLNPAHRRIKGLAGGNTAREVWNRSPPIASRIPVDANQVLNPTQGLAPLRPACRMTDANVPFGMSSPWPPLTVTRPGFTGCLNWRWLPFVTTRTHPSSSSILMTSRTFIPQSYSTCPRFVLSSFVRRTPSVTRIASFEMSHVRTGSARRIPQPSQTFTSHQAHLPPFQVNPLASVAAITCASGFDQRTK